MVISRSEGNALNRNIKVKMCRGEKILDRPESEIAALLLMSLTISQDTEGQFLGSSSGRYKIDFVVNVDEVS